MELNFSKYADGLIPAIIQDASTRVVLMLGFMNQEALDKTIETGKVTFYSRTRKTLWTKGETSGNFLNFVSASVDCDNDTLLVKVHPIRPTCHKGTDTCWAEENTSEAQILSALQEKIDIEFVRLIQLYHFLKRTKLSLLISKLFPLFENLLLKNLKGKNPSLLIFNVFSVGFICK